MGVFVKACSYEFNAASTNAFPSKAGGKVLFVKGKDKSFCPKKGDNVTITYDFDDRDLNGIKEKGVD